MNNTDSLEARSNSNRQPRDDASSASRVMLVAIPKSGNYLFGKLLDVLGFQKSGFAFYATGVADRRGLGPEQFRQMDRSVKLPLPIQCSLPLVKHGHYGHGPLPCTYEIENLLDDFRILFVKRNLRDVLVSHMRWTAATVAGTHRTPSWRHLQDTPEKFIAYLKDIGIDFLLETCFPMARWQARRHVLSVDFETFHGDHGDAARDALVLAVAEHCRVPNASSCTKGQWGQLIGAPTLTWSGRRTDWRRVWSQPAEQLFAEAGGPQLNRLLGYPEGRFDALDKASLSLPA